MPHASHVETDTDWRLVPPDLRDPLEAYFLHGRVPDDFLTAILANDLRNAIGHADSARFSRLPHILYFLMRNAPDRSWGSGEKVAHWEHIHGLCGRAALYKDLAL